MGKVVGEGMVVVVGWDVEEEMAGGRGFSMTSQKSAAPCSMVVAVDWEGRDAERE